MGRGRQESVLSPSLYLGSQDEWLSLQGSSEGSEVEFAILNSCCPCPIPVSDVAKANTLDLPFRSIAGAQSRFEGQGQDRK